jgi:hypothetical protein
VVTTNFEDAQRFATEKNAGMHGMNSLAPSIGAIFPFYDVDGRLLIHGPGNIALTAQCLNYAKHFFAPAVLQIVSDYLKTTGDEAARLEMMEKMDSVWLVGLLSAFSRASRLSNPLAMENFATQKEVWVAAEPIDEVPSAASRQWCGAETGKSVASIT